MYDDILMYAQRFIQASGTCIKWYVITCLLLQIFVPVPLQLCTGKLYCDCLLHVITRNTGMGLLILLISFTAPLLCSVVTPGTILVDRKAPRASTAAGSRLSQILPPCVPPRSIRLRRDYGGPRDRCRDIPTRTAYIHHCSVSGATTCAARR